MSNSHFSDAADSGVDLLAESPRLTLTQLSRREGKAVSTAWRWSLRGCRGVRLETFLHAGTRCTTGPAFERFIARINGDSPLSSSAPATNRQREAAIAAAEQELADAGV